MDRCRMQAADPSIDRMTNVPGVKLSVCMGTFRPIVDIPGLVDRSYSVEELFRTTKQRIRAHGIEANAEMVREHFDELDRYSRQYDLPVLGVLAPTGPKADGSSCYGYDAHEFGEVCRKTRELGGTYVTGAEPDHFSTGEGIARVLTNKAEAEGMGLSYFLETHRDSITEDPEDARTIADAIPDLMFSADLSHWVIQNYSGDEITWIFPRVGNIQVRVASMHNVQVEVGDGRSSEVHAFMRDIIAPILEMGFHGVVSTELLPGGYVNTQRYYPAEDTVNLVRELRSRFPQHIAE